MQKINKLTIYNIIFLLRATTLLAPIMLLFYQYNGLSAQELFFFQGIFYLTSILSEIPIGYLSNIIPRKRVLLLSFLIYVTVITLWLSIKGYFIILFGEIFFAISKIMMDNAMSGYLYDFLLENKSENKMPKQYSYLNFYLALGTTFAAIIGTYIYSHYGIKQVLICQIFILSVAIALLSLLPNIKITRDTNINLKNSVKVFSKSINEILRDKNIKYHIFQSGLLTSCSILFAISFQPIIQNALLPVYMFGVVAFVNHGTRAIASFISGKFNHNFRLGFLSNFLLVTYIISFILILLSYKTDHQLLTIVTIILICIFIGIQLIFTVLHISRLHKHVPNNSRGSVMAVNNFISRATTATILISSKLLIDKKLYFENYYICILLIFIILCIYFNKKINDSKEIV